MKTCPKCGYDKLADTARFCHKCGCDCAAVQVKRTPAAEAPEAAPLVGDKNLINESTIIGKQEKYEASNITIHNNITEDHSHTTIVCAVSGKRIYLDHSVVCPKCGKQMKRVPEVIDCWFDSGSMPFAQHHYPFENKETFEKQFPAQFISEAVDQTRGWFYSLLAISTLLFNKAPYENVIVLGLVQDENGQKMSKSKGNVVDPLDIVEEYGADTLRTYVLFMGDYGAATPWSENSVKGCKKFLDRVAGLTDILSEESVSDELEMKLHRTIKKVSSDIESLKFNTAIASLMTLINEITAEGHIGKEDLGIFIKLLSPFAPHLCEEIWEFIGGEGLLAVSEWPKYDEGKTIAKTVEIGVQVNGKVRGTIVIPNGCEKEKEFEIAKADERIASFLEGKNLIKEIYVPNKIVNFVAK